MSWEKFPRQSKRGRGFSPNTYWCHLSTHKEDLTNSIFRPENAVEGLHVERLNLWRGSLRDVVHECFRGDSLPILGVLSVWYCVTIQSTYPWWAVKDHTSLNCKLIFKHLIRNVNTYLPWYTELSIAAFRIKESNNILDNGDLFLLLQNDILPV